METKAEFAVTIIKQYAKEHGTTPRGTTDLSPMEEWLISELYKVSLPLNFWQRLRSFVSDVQTGCCMGEEEKEMIIFVCKNRINDK